jgi:hypothetical protein
MQDKNLETDWTWTPVPQRPRTRVQAIGALVIMAASCIAAGFVVGRITAGTPSDEAPRQTALSQARGSETPSAAPIGEGAKKTVLPAPSAALKREPERMGDAPATATPAGAAPPVVLLNPGTADGGKEDNQPRGSNPRIRDASELTSTRPIGEGDAELRDNQRQAARDRKSRGVDDRRESAPSGTERDYHALRDYMLSR